MKSIMKKVMALSIILVMLFATSSQAADYIVHILKNSRSNGVKYTYTTSDGTVHTVEDYYVGDEKNYSYYCLSGGTQLRDDMEEWWDPIGTYTNKTEWNAFTDKSIFKNNNPEPVKWLVKNMYSETTDVKTNEYMLDHLNNIIKKYAPNGYKDCDVRVIGEMEFIEVLQQMVIWSYVNNKYDSYDKIINSESDIGNIVFGGYTYKDTAAQKAGYALYKALEAGAKDRKYSIEESNKDYELTLKKGTNFGLENGQNNTYTLGPITLGTNSNINKDLIQSVTDSLNISTKSISYLDSNKKAMTVSNKKDLIGKTYYIKFTTANALADGKTVTYRCDADLGYRISNMTANLYTREGRQPILQLRKTLKNNGDTKKISTEVSNEFDIALTKQIISVARYSETTKQYEDVMKFGSGSNATSESRLKNIDKEALTKGTGTTATYTMDKTPVTVAVGDKVTYRITAYNEGGSVANIQEITDYLPKGLKYVGISTNHVLENNITASYDDTKNIVKINNTFENISAYDKNNENMSYIYVDVTCLVTDEATQGEELINYAAVTKYSKKDGTQADKDGIDRDSEQNDTIDFESYAKRIEVSRKWFDHSKVDKGAISQQDDDDFEIVKVGKFDLALRKFISSVNDKVLDGENSREPTFTIRSAASLMATGTAIYNHPKTPVSVKVNDKVVYTIRVYNEGSLDGYAKEIVDYLPEGLELTENSQINSKYGWTKQNGTNAVKSSYLSNTLLSAGNEGKSIAKGVAAKDYTGTSVEPKFLADVQIECTVKNKNSKNLVNVAEISNYGYNEVKQDDSGNTILEYKEAKTEGVDRDSEEDNVFSKDSTIKNNDDYYEKVIKSQMENEKSNYTGLQDDDDFEMLKVEPFDLALRKYITSVNGQTLDGGNSREPVFGVDSITALRKYGTAIYNHPKTPVSVKVGDKVVYTIRVYNEGYLDGYAEEITDYLPAGLKFVENSEINKEWTATTNEDGTTTVKTTKLKDTLIAAGNGGELMSEAFSKNDNTGTTVEPKFMAEVQIECEVTSRTGGKLVNVAEITKYGYESNGQRVYASSQGIDRDSEQDNVFNSNSGIADSINKYFSRINYNNENITYYPGIQDDDDFEVVEVAPNNYKFTLNKVDEAGNALNGAKFTITLDGKDLINNQIVNGSYSTSDSNAILLNIYTYKIVENESALGYKNILNGNYILMPVQLDQTAKIVKGNINTGSAENDVYYNKYGFVIMNSKNEIVTEENTDLYNKIKTNINNDSEVPEAQITIPNEMIKGKYSLEIEKTDTNNNKLSGVTFKVNDTQTKATGEDGKVTVIENKEITADTVNTVDTYKISEVKAASEYITLNEELAVYVSKKLDGEEYKLDKASFSEKEDITTKEVTLKDGTKVNVTLNVKGNVVTVTIPNKLEEEKTGKYSLVIEKVDTQNAKLSGVTFKVNDKETQETGKDGKVTVIENKAISKSTVKDVDTYKISEVKVSGDYVSIDEELTVYVSKKEEEKAYVLDKASFSEKEDVTTKEVTLKDGSKVNVTLKVEDNVITVTVPNKPLEFDLALRKWVTKAIVIEDGKQTITQTGHKAEDDPEDIVKVEINRKKLNSTVVKFEYQIRVTNEGEIEGYAKEISDYIPEGLKFNQEDNPTWKEVSGKVTTDQLKDTLLQPGQSAEVTIVLTWINGEDNMGLKVNTAEISEDYNKYGKPDKDSTPNNKVPGEDDIDDAPVMLTISTGKVVTYFAISLSVLTILVVGIAAIKKYVL